MNPLARAGLRMRAGFGRMTPEPFTITVALTVIVMIAAVAYGEYQAEWSPAPVEVVSQWHAGGGLWKLLTFAMQCSLMLVVGTALAAAAPVRRAIDRLIAAARSPRQLAGLTALVSIALAIANWSLGLICGALFARAAGASARRAGWALHYPILCAAGYSGLMVWHGGLSGSAPLKATTRADMVEVVGAELAARVGTIPLEDSLFGPLNLVVTGGLLLLGPLVFVALTPPAGRDPEHRAIPAAVAALAEAAPESESQPQDTLERIERSPLFVWLLAAPMLMALALYLYTRGIGRVDLNTVILALWLLAMALHGRPHRFLAACEEGMRGCTGIFLLFPLYAGIMGVLAGSGLSTRIALAFADAGEGLFTTLSFLSAGLLNLFVPSGGGQWAIQGPILLEAALARGLAPADAMMAMAYGDQWTNMLQPFWAVPLLAVTGVRARDIVGYCVVWMAIGGAWMVGCLLLLT